ncbi:4Fe-4S ferredoxin [Denitrobacterium detoxificans]|uniref:Ferredoxin-type protein NapH n=1 Tax=Denitrobacterium detoxificans TaxID=79604 RepID=A0A172RZS4_9ACTN|nr:4Fe-4S binding protein [Denitrobacterium detoxificans]ANE23237.1 4Fe-4S ferredoxin [Denitrobacterium detoxificans]SEO37248.1 ferredoxin-type protein NapH [Denitrobacterium detoxificans]
MSGTSKRFKIAIARRVVQVVALLIFAAPVIVAGWGVFGGIAGNAAAGGDGMVATPAALPFFGTLSSSSIFGVAVLDPFAMLEVIAASKTFSPSWLLAALPVLIVYGLIRGRAFCGWVCPVNLLCEGLDWLRARLHIFVRERVVPRHAKLYIALGILFLSAVLGFPLFEALSPIGFVAKGIVLGSMAGGLTLLAIVLLELFCGHRVWCRALCPLGGFYEALGRVGLVNVTIDHGACIGCDRCKQACLCDPQILDDAVSGVDGMVRAGDCMACGKCVDACPTHALAIGMTIPRPQASSGTAQGGDDRA